MNGSRKVGKLEYGVGIGVDDILQAHELDLVVSASLLCIACRKRSTG